MIERLVFEHQHEAAALRHDVERAAARAEAPVARGHAPLPAATLARTKRCRAGCSPVASRRGFAGAADRRPSPTFLGFAAGLSDCARAALAELLQGPAVYVPAQSVYRRSSRCRTEIHRKTARALYARALIDNDCTSIRLTEFGRLVALELGRAPDEPSSGHSGAPRSGEPGIQTAVQP